MDWLNAAVAVGSGLLGAQSSKQGTSTTSENKLDPRMDRFVYGADGQSGLLGSAFDLAQQQLKTGGLNDMQRQGMDMQRQYLMSPQYQQGFGNMAQLGQSLMGGGVAGNPFTGGQAVRGAAPAPAFNYSGAMNAQLPDFKLQPSMLTPENTQALNGLLSGGGGGGGGAIGSGGGASSGGQGISSAGIAAALAAMSASENPALRALSPTLAAALGIGGRLGADHQIGAIGRSFDAMGAIDGMGLGGVGSIADADGNIRSITTPGMVGAYDAATFGGAYGGYGRGFGGGDNGRGNSGTGGGSNVGSRGNGGSGD